MDAASEEFVTQLPEDEDDAVDRLILGPAKWAAGRGYDPKIINSVVLKAFADVGQDLPADFIPERLIPHREIQAAVNARAPYWVARTADFEAVQAGAGDANPVIEVAEHSVQAETGGDTATWPWEQLRITFMNPQTVRLEYPGIAGNSDFAAMGFADDRSGRPIQAWAALLELARSGGEIANPFGALKKWSQVESAIKDLRKRLMRHFCHPQDPIQTVMRGPHKGAYVARFDIRLRPGFDSPLSEEESLRLL